MNDSEGAALLAAINENLNDLAPRLIYSDWLQENGRTAESAWWSGDKTMAFLTFENYAYFGVVDDFWDGFGDGTGNDGDGSGSGDGSGHSCWISFGEFSSGASEEVASEVFQIAQIKSDWMHANQKILEGSPMIGKQMLIWCGRGFAWIGHVNEMYAPGCYKLSNAGMLCRTGPDSWMAVASGEARDNYVYRHAPDGIVYTGPEIHGAVEWKGELPGRDMR